MWCLKCKLRHGYMSKTLGVNYEKRGNVFHVLWYCKKYGDVLKDQPLRRTNEVPEAGDQGQ